jgi:hypothetical protein
VARQGQHVDGCEGDEIRLRCGQLGVQGWLGPCHHRRVDTGLTVRPFDRDPDTVELGLMRMASFEQGVGVIDPHPVEEQTARASMS